MVIHSLLRSGRICLSPFLTATLAVEKKKRLFLHVEVLVILGLKGRGDSLHSKSKHRHYHYELLFLMSLILFTAITADAHISILSGQINLSKLLINIPGRILDFITAFPGLGRRR